MQESLPTHTGPAPLVMRGRVASLTDKGKGALLNTESELLDPISGKVYCRLVSGVFLRGVGGASPR